MTNKKSSTDHFLSKKELLGNLIAGLLEDLSEDEKKKMLRSATQSSTQSRDTIELVEQ